MEWSRYSRLFLSRRNGWLLYNAATNSFLQLEDPQAEDVRAIMAAPDGFDFSRCPQLYILLRAGGYLVDPGRDDAVFNILKMRRLSQRYANDSLLVTVAITRACNFDCSYCYEANRTGQPMTEEVAEKLVDFIRKFKVQHRHITWYGGEPLLAFPRIRQIHGRLKELGIDYLASLITNGYLLEEPVIRELGELGIRFIQITLDGSQKTHDSRRFLKGGGATFDRILGNLDKLMASGYDGSVSIRVNVDGRNAEEFMEVHRLIASRYSDAFGERICVYPGFVHGDSHPDAGCFFDSDKKGNFIAQVAEKHGVKALSLFPRMPSASCTLTKQNAFVVGPEGELYKCWNDVGIPSQVVGSIESLTGWNLPLIAQGMVAASYLDAEECRECFYFPICDGGCHKIRMENLQEGKRSDVCSYFKHHLEELLELHYEQKDMQSGAR